MSKGERFQLSTGKREDLYRCHCDSIILYRNRYRHWKKSCMAEMSEAKVRYLLKEKL